MPKSTISFLGLELVPGNFGNWSGPGWTKGLKELKGSMTFSISGR